MGNRFTLRSDHRPLEVLFGESTGTPQMAAGRIQRWAIFLSNFNYTLEYIKGSTCKVDGMSRLPINYKREDVKQMEYIHWVEDFVPVDFKQIRHETRKDVTFSKVLLSMKNGWPKDFPGELLPFYRRKSELYEEDGAIMWGYRVLVPEKLRHCVLRELHSTHLGATKMKAVARQYFWWPGLDHFCAKNSVIHLTSPPFRPASNGAAENSVKSFKAAIKKMVDEKQDVPIHTHLQQYLSTYRNAQHSTTGKKPSDLVLKFHSLTRFDNIRYKTGDTSFNQVKNYSGQRIRKQLNMGDKVYYRVYNERDKKWKPGVVDDTLGNCLYLVKGQSSDLIHKRHVIQIIEVDNNGGFVVSDNVVVPNLLTEEKKKSYNDHQSLTVQQQKRQLQYESKEM